MPLSRRLQIWLLAIALVAVVVPMSSTAVALEAAPSDESMLELYEVTGPWSELAQLPDLDVEVVRTVDGAPGQPTGTVRAIASAAGVKAMSELSVSVEAVRGVTGETNSALSARRQGQFSVWRDYSSPGGIRDEIEQLAADNPNLVKLLTIGQSVQGQPIYALKVTAGAPQVADGSRPATGYISAQHAREWITVETNRRLVHHFVDNYETDPTINALLNTTELWFVLVANPDGYDFTFSTERLWRKNLADNNGDGSVSNGDGVDLNRNFSEQWGYDNEGSSGSRFSEVYRGPSAMSEPETRAVDVLLAAANLEFFFNVHSAVGLMLYGVGWQVATSAPDDHIGRALIGDDASPAVPGYNPGIGAELYIVNGDTNDYAQNVRDAFGIVMELDTCDQAEEFLPNDGFGSSYCEATGRSVFEFPDDETLIDMVFQKNLPLFLAGAQSAANPDSPVSVSGYTTPEIAPVAFAVAHGTSQMVAADVKRSLGPVTMRYRINGGAEQSAAALEWGGGNRYGNANNVFYAEVRGQVMGVNAGDSVQVWFVAGGAQSDPFTYSVTSGGADVLVVAHEDYAGFSPVQSGVTAPRYTSDYVIALNTNGYSSQIWDVVTQGIPDPLGVLGQYGAVVWELGDNQVTQTESDNAFDLFGGGSQLGVSEVQHFLTLAMRDYMNEGGKLIAAGQYTGWFNNDAQAFGGYFYAKDGDPLAPCVIVESIFECLLYSDDFAEYYLGISNSGAASGDQSVSLMSPAGAVGPLSMVDTTSGNALSVTSAQYPVATHPQFESRASATYAGGQTAGVTTRSSVAFGFGLEDVLGSEAQAQAIGAALATLGVNGSGGSPMCGGRLVTVDIGAGQVPTSGADVILGTPGPDAIAAGDGDDFVCGAGGNDTIWGQGGDDTLFGDTGDDKMRGGNGDDVLRGGDGVDDLSGGRGNDGVFGEGGDDKAIRGGTGDDVVDGGDGNDALIAGNGGADQVSGGAGDDPLVTGGPRPDIVSGGAGNDIVKGHKGADIIHGDAGNDDLRGGPQPDTIDGGAGIDTCNGGTTGDGATESDTTVNCESALNVP